MPSASSHTPAAFWIAVDADNEAAAIEVVRAGAVPLTLKRAVPSLLQRGLSQTPASVALEKNWIGLLEALLDAGWGPDARCTPKALPLLGEAVFRANAQAVSLLVARGASLDVVAGRGASSETLWGLLVRSSWGATATPEAVRAIADVLCAASVPLSAPAAVGAARNPAFLAVFDRAPRADASALPFLSVFMDPCYGWDWSHPRLLKNANPCLAEMVVSLRASMDLETCLPDATRRPRVRSPRV